MAETAVCYLIDKLIPLLTEKVNLFRGVHGDLLEIKSELVFVRAFLRDADQKAGAGGDTNEGVKAWVEELRDVAFKIEDVVDEYTYRMTIQHPKRNRFSDFLNKLIPLHDIEAQILVIKATVRSITERRERYGFNCLQQTHTGMARKWHDPRKASLFLMESEVIGFESPIDELIGALKSSSPQRVVTSVVGMGGLGKTTLAKQVYNRMKGQFDCHAWITVSESYKIEDILRNLIQKFCDESVDFVTENAVDSMDEETLTIHIRKYLQKKRYLVVFDDVWNNEFWGDIEHALLDNENGGRILMTTRNIAVANSCKRSSLVNVHMLKHLPRDKAMELFCKKIFQFESGGCFPPELDKLSFDIVSRCQGLPLAIVAVAGLLSTKDKTVYHWKRLLESLSLELMNLSYIERILLLSYNDLPYNLKCCLLYFGMFPKSYSVRCGRLIRQWIAEDFVKFERGKTLEDVAKSYLTELIDRSLVEISKVDGEGKAKTCRVHDLLHDVIFKKMEELSFCQVFSGDELSGFKGVTRRLSIIGSSDNNLATIDVSRVRWFSMFNKDQKLNSIVSKIAADSKLLKVLDFEDNQLLDHLPEDIGNLFHLRYLSVRGTMVNFLPKSIGKLVNLETLDLEQSLVYEIPIEINRLLNLRHLLGGRRGIRVKGIEPLKHLQKICFIETNNTEFDILKELGTLTQLRTLCITKLRSEDGRSLCICVENMKFLESLSVSSTSENDILDLESIACPPEYLRRLYLEGPLRKLPEWIEKLTNLAKISIRGSKLADNPLKVLGILSELVDLEIAADAFVGDQLHFEEGRFLKLKSLQLYNLKGLRSLIIGEGALHVLEKLHLLAPNLKEVPFGIRHLKNLKVLCFLDLPNELMESMDPNRGQNYQIVQHVPAVFSFYKHGLREFGWKQC